MLGGTGTTAGDAHVYVYVFIKMKLQSFGWRLIIPKSAGSREDLLKSQALEKITNALDRQKRRLRGRTF